MLPDYPTSQTKVVLILKVTNPCSKLTLIPYFPGFGSTEVAADEPKKQAEEQKTTELRHKR